MCFVESKPRYFKNRVVDREKEIIRNQYVKENFNILKYVMIGPIFYAAVTDLENKNKVFALIVQTRVRKTGFFKYFGVQFFNEKECPEFFDCPKQVLDLLTETDNVKANIWRNKCLEVIKNKNTLKNLETGTVIKILNCDLEEDTFVLERGNRTKQWVGENTDYLLKDAVISRYEFQVV